MIETFNAIATLANVPPIKTKRVIRVDTDDEVTPITVWWKRPVRKEEFAGSNEDGYREIIVHQGIQKSINHFPF